MTDRRDFIRAAASALIAIPFTVEAQQAAKVYRVGFIVGDAEVSALTGPEPVHSAYRAFVQGMRALGYVEGQNLILERRSAEVDTSDSAISSPSWSASKRT